MSSFAVKHTEILLIRAWNIYLNDWNDTSFVAFIRLTQNIRRYNALGEQMMLKIQFQNSFSIRLVLHIFLL